MAKTTTPIRGKAMGTKVQGVKPLTTGARQAAGAARGGARGQALRARGQALRQRAAAAGRGGVRSRAIAARRPQRSIATGGVRRQVKRPV